MRIGITLAHFSSTGNIPVSNVRFTICVIGSIILSIVFDNSFADIPSSP